MVSPPLLWLGALSDKSVNKGTGRRLRRPWVVVGQLLFCIICTVLLGFHGRIVVSEIEIPNAS